MGLTLVFGGLSLLGLERPASVTTALVVLIVLQTAILYWRRSQPVAVLLASILITLAAAALTPDREPGTPALVFAVYAVSVYDRGRTRLWVAVAAIVLVALAVVVALFSDADKARLLVPAGASSLIAWVVGDYVRSRRSSFAELVTRHRQERVQAAEEERLRIARELHDVVAHNVSAIAIQAGAARISGSSSQEALMSIEQGARDTLAELNKLLGVLRKEPGAPLAPQPTLEDAEALLKPAREAGLDASLKVTGDRRSLPIALDLSAYRIIQEALTNVLKHADATRVEVAIAYQPDSLELTVSDNGIGSKLAGSTGHGLVGMRERVEIFGGDLTTGSSSLGGFTVRATLPVKA